MTVLSLYFKDALASGSSHGSIQIGGTGPSTATTTTAATVAKNGATLYKLGQYAGTVTGFASTAMPNAAPTTNDAFRTEGRFFGTFANTNWTIAIAVISVGTAATGTGRLRFRVWKSKNVDGTSATELTTATLTTTSYSNLLTSAAQNLSVTWTPGGSFTLDGDYLFFQFAYETQTASGSNSANVTLRVDATNSKITTPDFTLGDRPWDAEFPDAVPRPKMPAAHQKDVARPETTEFRIVTVAERPPVFPERVPRPQFNRALQQVAHRNEIPEAKVVYSGAQFPHRVDRASYAAWHQQYLAGHRVTRFPVTEARTLSFFVIANDLEYDGAPWRGQGSSGASESAGRDAASYSSGTDPAGGSAVNGYVPADFGAASGYHPLQEGSAILYYDFASGHVTTVSGAISAVSDQSGNGRGASQGTAGNRPALGATAEYFNGNQYAAPDGSDDVLDTGTWTAVTQPTTHYGATAWDSTSDNSPLFDALAGATAQQRFTSQGSINVNRAAIYAGGSIDGGGMPTDGTPFVWCIAFDGPGSAIYINDMTTPLFTGNPGSNGIESMRLFADQGGGTYFGGKHAQNAAFAASHDQAARLRVANYLTEQFLSPRALTLSGYWRADGSDYTSGTWLAETSLGSSGTQGSLTEATNPPSVVSVNGHDAPSFDGVNDKLGIAAAGTLISNGATQFAFGCLVKARSSVDGDTVGNGYVFYESVSDAAKITFYESGDEQIINGVIADGVTYQSVSIHMRSGGNGQGWSLGEYHLIMIRCDGVNVQGRIDNGPWVTGTACTQIGAAVSQFNVGYNSATIFSDMILPELFWKNGALTDAQSDLYWHYVVNRYLEAPAKLPLSGWMRANGSLGWQASVPSDGSICYFAGVPSLGQSTFNLGMVAATATGLVPGTYTLDGHDMPNFDGVDDYIPFARGYGNQEWTAGAHGYIAALIYADTAPTASGTNYADGNIYTDPNNAEVTLGVVTVSGTSKLVACILSGATYVRHPGVACSTGAWHFVEMRYDSTNLSLRVDGGSWSNTACGAWDVNTPSTPICGRSYLGNVFFDGKIAEMFTSLEALTDAQSAVLYKYLKARYPSAGLP